MASAHGSPREMLIGSDKNADDEHADHLLMLVNNDHRQALVGNPHGAWMVRKHFISFYQSMVDPATWKNLTLDQAALKWRAMWKLTEATDMTRLHYARDESDVDEDWMLVDLAFLLSATVVCDCDHDHCAAAITAATVPEAVPERPETHANRGP